MVMFGDFHFLSNSNRYDESTGKQNKTEQKTREKEDQINLLGTKSKLLA